VFRSLTYTCRLNEVNPFDYLTQLQRHADRVAASPQLWMPWSYRDALTNESGTHLSYAPPGIGGSDLAHVPEGQDFQSRIGKQIAAAVV
jgi:hypothetical protein